MQMIRTDCLTSDKNHGSKKQQEFITTGYIYISPGGPEMMRGIPHVEFIGHCITFGIAVSVNSF